MSARGLSRAPWPTSAHNKQPSQAVDLAPWPIDWEDTASFHRRAGVILGMAHLYGMAVRWGGDWDSDGNTTDQLFNDLVHFELDD